MASLCRMSVHAAPRSLAPVASAGAHSGEQKAPSTVPAAVGAAQGPLSRRQLALGLGAAVGAWSLSLRERDSAAWALLDEDDDDDLLERVKRERKERRVKEEALRPEGDALQNAVSDLRTVGVALDAGDYAAAKSAAAEVAALTADGGAVADALAKLSVGSVAPLRSGIADLVAALSSEDSIKAKKAFVASATALKDLADAVGLAGSLKGL